jgi:hypothetical protein
MPTYCFLLNYLGGGWESFKFYWTKRYWYMGEVVSMSRPYRAIVANSNQATIVMCLILVVSLYGLRKHFYETFLILHIYLSLVVLITMW